MPIPVVENQNFFEANRPSHLGAFRALEDELKQVVLLWLKFGADGGARCCHSDRRVSVQCQRDSIGVPADDFADSGEHSSLFIPRNVAHIQIALLVVRHVGVGDQSDCDPAVVEKAAFGNVPGFLDRAEGGDIGKE